MTKGASISKWNFFQITNRAAASSNVRRTRTEGTLLHKRLRIEVLGRGDEYCAFISHLSALSPESRCHSSLAVYALSLIFLLDSSAAPPFAPSTLKQNKQLSPM